MLLQYVQLNTYYASENAGVINLFSQKHSKSQQPYQTKKILKSSVKESETLEYFLLPNQKEREISSNPINLLNPIKPDHLGQPNPNKGIPIKKLKNMPGMPGMAILLRTSNSNFF